MIRYTLNTNSLHIYTSYFEHSIDVFVADVFVDRNLPSNLPEKGLCRRRKASSSRLFEKNLASGQSVEEVLTAYLALYTIVVLSAARCALESRKYKLSERRRHTVHQPLPSPLRYDS